MSAFIEEVEPVATPSRWPAHFDTNVKIYQSFRRGDGNYVGLEREPGCCCRGASKGYGCRDLRDHGTLAAAVIDDDLCSATTALSGSDNHFARF